MINRISLRNKLVISFILIILPMFLLSFFSINLYSREIKNKLMTSAVGNNEQIIHNLDNSLNMLAKLSEYPIYDEKLIEILKKDYDLLPNYKHARSTDFGKVNDLLITNIVFYSNLIDSVWLYGFEDYDLRGRALVETMNAGYKISDESWLERIISQDGGSVIIGIHQDKQKLPGNNFVISIGRLIKDKSTREKIGIILINVDVRSLEQLWMDRGITRNTLFYIIDENDQIIYSQNRDQLNKSIDTILEEDMNFDALSGKEILLQGERYQLISTRSSMSKWKVLSIIPTKELFSYNLQMYQITSLIGIAVVLLSVAVAYLITTSITRPVVELSGSMRKMGEGDFDVSIGEYYGEMGIIGKAISMMQTRIKNLIQKIYIEEEEKRRAEMMALQAQINPHFLYNTISAIKWMASIQGAASIEKALSSLAFLMAYTSKWDYDFVSIADEMVFVENYISILDIRFYNKFKVTYNIDSEVYPYQTLKFLLQPIIENAVFHGFEGMDEKGEMTIDIRKEADNILFNVSDNGRGFDQKKLKSILEGDQHKKDRQRFNSIGLANVNKRIKLHFGEQYGLSIQSTLKKGTDVTILIPAIAAKGGNDENTDSR